MGRYPLMAAVEDYLEKKRNKVVEKTLNNDARNLREIANVLENMRENGAISTTNPQKIGPGEIRSLITWMMDPLAHRTGKPLDINTQDRYLRKLEKVLESHGNKVLQLMRDEGYSLPQRNDWKPLHTIPSEDLRFIREAAERIRPAKGEPHYWRRAKARLIASFYIATGLRPNELTRVKMDELDLIDWIVRVSHPKGEGKYGREREVKILQDFRADVRQFLEDRQRYIVDCGMKNSAYFIPNLRGKGDKHYSSNHFREIKAELEELSGVRFQLKDFRTTFASMFDDIDPNTAPDVMTQLGQRNEKTYRTFYARIKAGMAGQRLEKAWANRNRVDQPKSIPEDQAMKAFLGRWGINSVEELEMRLGLTTQETENHLIDPKKRLPGYF